MTKVSIHCAYCGKDMWVSPSRLGSNRYCSKQCQFLSMKKPRAIRVICTCKQCGLQFEIREQEVLKGQGKYCSTKCQKEGARKKVDFSCIVCGSIFVTCPSKIVSGRVYCCRECGLIGKKLKTSGENSVEWKGGVSQYRGKNWREQRKLAYERDGGKCQNCHKNPKKCQKQFEVHHIKPFRSFNGDYVSANDLSNLITLCVHCHRRAEKGSIPIPKRLL